MKFTFIKTAPHRTFNHNPIYYDPAKEEREKRNKRIRSELGQEIENDKESIEDRVRGQMRRKIKGNFDVARKEKKRSNIRLAIILLGLIVAFYYLLMSSAEWILKYM
ncbi:hypothetical protein SAMN06265379_11147 [Saccharicrinis carchari]|uniref:Uncharacterized protein n=1 Tax=Saccharicrinis carchari TaxID=1168039 RepID=A0A521EU60_SACCC|nr:hypothetical protein [Saccharicrinis carchari]SMO87444.1 hypothetical protein SAMN06265379_11147 [Saccharicrinis carchari]